MKRNVLDHEISSLLLGELNYEEVSDLKERLLKEDGNLDRIDRLKAEDEAFLARFPGKVFAAQVESGLRKKSFESQTSKHDDKKREGRMVIGKRILLGVAVLTVVGFSANHLHSKLEDEVSFAPSKTAAVEPVKVKKLEADFASLQITVRDASSDNEAFDALNRFMKEYELEEDPDRVLWVYDKYATLLGADRGGVAMPAGASFRSKIVKAFAKLSKEQRRSLDISKDGVAKSLFLASEEHFLKMSSLSMTTTSKADSKKLREKQESMMALRKTLMQIRSLGVPRWTVAANYRRATMLVDTSDSVRRSVPDHLSPEKTAEISKMLEHSAMGGEISAMNILKEGLAIEGVQSQYVSESRILLERLKTKICPTESEIEALHSTIWQVEHGSLFTARKNIGRIGDRTGVHLPEVFELRKKLRNNSLQVELLSDAEALRVKMEDWVCMSKDVHEKFHNRIANTPIRIPDELNRADIKPTIDQSRGLFRECSQKLKKPVTKTIQVRFSIEPSGRAGGVSLPRKFQQTKLGSCVEDVFSRMTFPETKRGHKRVTYPISFSPPKGDQKSEQKDEAEKDRDLLDEAIGLLVSGDTSAAIKKCSNVESLSDKVKIGCYRMLSNAYYKQGDIEKSCKYQRLAKQPVLHPKCNEYPAGSGKEIDEK